MADAHWQIDTGEEKQTAEGLILTSSLIAAEKAKEVAIPVIEESKKKFFASYDTAASN
ncbi:MAG: hypothetical protein HC845_12045 [Akkermansiaceae bacterium]|nr:hypothetical protein [Akkermansiaceae bacterium]